MLPYKYILRKLQVQKIIFVLQIMQKDNAEYKFFLKNHIALLFAIKLLSTACVHSVTKYNKMSYISHDYSVIKLCKCL